MSSSGVIWCWILSSYKLQSSVFIRSDVMLKHESLCNPINFLTWCLWWNSSLCYISSSSSSFQLFIVILQSYSDVNVRYSAFKTCSITKECFQKASAIHRFVMCKIISSCSLLAMAKAFYKIEMWIFLPWPVLYVVNEYANLIFNIISECTSWRHIEVHDVIFMIMTSFCGYKHEFIN